MYKLHFYLLPYYALSKGYALLSLWALKNMRNNKIKFRNIKSLDYCGISIFKERKSQWTDEASHVDGVLQNQRMEKPQSWNLRYQIHSGQLSSDTPLSKIYI